MVSFGTQMNTLIMRNEQPLKSKMFSPAGMLENCVNMLQRIYCKMLVNH